MKVGDLVTIIQPPFGSGFDAPGDVGIIISVQLGLNENADKFVVQTRNNSLAIAGRYLEVISESR